ncbi:recombinase family protein, partial [Klebsiella pneumoniae]|uniref:recombinase family protein n=1 Tax=Klebsiella pneumoniae TaxID=573 RepID=UPI002246FB2C
MKIGYARKSTHLQDVAHQVDELTKAGCEQIYQDQTSRSGPKRDKKGAPELENCLKALREGDTLVVWALDRLGGSWHCCKVSDEAAFCLIQRPYISKTLLTRRISPRG